MTKTDTSREAVARLCVKLCHPIAGFRPTVSDARDAAEIIRALLTERDALQARAERAEAGLVEAREGLTEIERLYYVEGKDAGFRAAHMSGVTRATLAQLDAEPHSDDLAVDRFAAAMKAKLAQKREEGYRGWDDPESCTTAFLSSLLCDHVAKGDPVDVGNFAMMLHQRGSKIDAEPAEWPECIHMTAEMARNCPKCNPHGAFDTTGAEERWCEDVENACSHCGGSGHKGDSQ